MLPILASGTYSATQFIDWDVQWYDTAMTVPYEGIGFRLGKMDSGFSGTTMRTTGSPATYMESNSTPVLDDGGGGWKWGRSPLVQEFWEYGAPLGITSPKRVVLHWRGTVVSDLDWVDYGYSNFWLAFSGKGTVRIVVGSPASVDEWLILKEDDIVLSSALTATGGSTQIDIYYWQDNEPWGGLVCKYVPQTRGGQTDVTDAEYRAAPVFSSAIASYTATPVSAVTLSNVIESSVRVQGASDLSSMSFSVPLRSADNSIGWKLLTNPRRLQHYDGTDTITLKRGQLIKLVGGFVGEQYDRFTGLITQMEESDGDVTVECASLDYRASRMGVENYPDKMSYCTFGYFNTTGTSEPIRGIRAYDSWAMQYAIQDLGYRAKLDSKLFYGREMYESSGSLAEKQDSSSNPVWKFKAKSLTGKEIRLARNLHYGNAGIAFDASQPEDDDYILPPDASSTVMDFMRKLADSYSYDIRVDASGDVVLRTRNNPLEHIDLDNGTVTYDPAAIRGYYRAYSSSLTEDITVNASRIDLVLVKKSGGGTIDYTVTSVGGAITYQSGTIDTSTTGSDQFFYDNRFTLSGDNSCVTTLYSGKWRQYEVHLSDNTGSAWSLNGLLTYSQDPDSSAYAESLSTTKQVLTLSTESEDDQARNHVVVVGRRKAAVTDSAKFNNPNNPEHEFYVALGVDPYSIWDPDADNYVGTRDSVIIVDDRVSDQDYADWAAQTLLTRQRTPSAAVSLTHTVIPVLEPGDHLTVDDVRYETVTGSDDAWVIGFTETYKNNEATVSIQTTAYAELPSYEPKEDIDLDTLESVYGGYAAIDVNITYPSIDGGTITNPEDNEALIYHSSWVSPFGGSTLSSDGNGNYVDATGLPWPPIPDSIHVMSWQNAYLNTAPWSPYKNNPYLKVAHIYDYGTKKIHLPVLAGDGSSPYDIDGMYIRNASGKVSVGYIGIDSAYTLGQIYGGTAPFYDPYTSEVPGADLVEINFDALISGYYRVSIFASKKHGNDPIRVAWLTEPGVDESEPESHWTYLSSGKDKVFLWDGVDNIGDWNKEQSEEYAWQARGVFQVDQKPQIGKGFYAWNDKTSPIVTISGQDDGSGKLIYNPDHYSQFFVVIECRADVFADTVNPVRTTSTLNLRTDSGQNPQPRIYIYTHLPQPNKIKIADVEDWDPTSGSWDRDNPSEAGWTGSPDTAGTIRNGKPIRVTLEAVPRGGYWFGSDTSLVSFKLHKQVHLAVNIMDQFLLREGTTWYPDTNIESKRLVCRRLTNDTHTLDFADADWRTGDTLDLSSGKWTFEPKDFLIDDESVRFVDYLQIEDVPSFSRFKSVGEPVSRLILAYMNYLFYLSVYIQDRSGRMVWAIDDSFTDTSKIINNTFATEFPEQLDEYHVRTILTRQWVETDHPSDISTYWGYSGNAAAVRFSQFYHKRLNMWDSDSGAALRISSTGSNVNGALTTSYTDNHSNNHSGDLYAGYTYSRQLGNTSNLNFFGDWTWEGTNSASNTTTDIEPLWIPAPSRDWHPYYLIPPMPFFGAWIWLGLYSESFALSKYYDLVNREDPTWSEIWQSYTLPMPDSTGLQKFSVGSSVESYTKNGEESQSLGGMIDYTRQNEQILWEHIRGMRTVGQKEGEGDDATNTPVYAAPSGGPYYINTMSYISFHFTKIVGASSGYSTNNVKTSAPVYPAGSSPNWFNYQFAHKYNWYSASYFPIQNSSGRFVWGPLYSKYQIWLTPTPFALAYDSGAWVGWKPDRTPAALGYKLFWENKTAGSTESGEDSNIFTAGGIYLGNAEPIPPMAVTESDVIGELKDVIMSVAFVNSRRLSPASGK